MATLVTLEQKNLTSPIKLTFRTIQRVPVKRGTSLPNSFSTGSMVLWHDYLIGPFVRTRLRTQGLFLWNTKENSIFYFEVCHTFFPSRSALNPNSRQMKFFPLCTKVIDDLCFIRLGNSDGVHWNAAYHAIHIPSLVNLAQLPGGTLSLTGNAFAVLLSKYACATGVLRSAHTTIYSLPASSTTHLRYCFIIERFLEAHQEVGWEVFEVEVDSSIPGPIKIISRVSQQYAVCHPACSLQDSNHDLLLYLPLGPGGLPCASLSVQFLRVRKPDEVRVARLEGVDEMALCGLRVDRDAGYVIIWAAKDWPRCAQIYSIIWWLDESKPVNMAHRRKRDLISSWGLGLLRRFWR